MAINQSRIYMISAAVIHAATPATESLDNKHIQAKR